MPRQSRLERVMEQAGAEDAARPRKGIGGLLDKLGSKGRFLAFAVVIAMVITGFVMWKDRYEAENDSAAIHTNEAQVGLGRTLYETNCAYCHGSDLKGKEGWDEDYPKGHRPALPLDGTAPIWRLSDRDIFDVTKYGGQPFSPPSYRNDMPSYEMMLADADIWAIIAYVKSRWTPEIHEKQRLALEAREADGG